MDGAARALAFACRPALALALVAGTAACAGSAPEPSRSPVAATSSASPSASRPPATPAVTLTEARDALDTYLATDDVVRAGRAQRWMLQLARDGQRPIRIAEYHSTGGKPPRYTWGERTLLVPRLPAKASRQWFAATVERRDSSGEVRIALLTFVRQNASSPWQNSFESLLYKDEKAPEVALDADGYAIALDPRDQSVAISPNLMGPLHATIAEEGKDGFASGLIAPGPQTTGYATEIKKRREKARQVDCMNYDSLFSAAVDYPVFALRTKDGGGLVLYTLLRTSKWSPVLNCGYGRPLAIPKDARWDLSNPVVRRERRIVETQQYASAVPPKSSTAPAHVIGYDGLVTKATTR
ncbi:hypothetical protein [Microtetraspora sp. NBRC 16547]|uniref:hypothetical protein n=1 Tax=Microtetraspora sp. NBRC 16547 TaxID=3030993 RepID=UPI0024A241A1|nr:hypothetical protein [Microtetraspora sp. NBRC 16547]GLW95972.1 hypothetical protein Misp02_00590 [Microtetraspora sp. NBRC 16547]